MRLLLALAVALPTLCGCRRASGVAAQSHSFYSPALARQVSYRMVVPARYPPGPVHVLYLLHGSGGTQDDWPDRSAIASLLPGSVLVMPYGANSYFMNSATRKDDRYEDFLTHDLIVDAERSLPAGARHRAIAGVSMGGCAAIIIAFRHPDLFPFAAGLSPAVDVPERTFNWHRPLTSMNLRSIFGEPGSTTRAREDPFNLALAADRQTAPYIFLSTGEEPLAAPIQRFAGLLQQRALPYELHVQPGGHGWASGTRSYPRWCRLLKRVSPRRRRHT